MTELIDDIRKAFAAIDTANHYQLLRVAKDASTESIRLAYLELAKRWHADRLAKAGLPPAVLQQADALFRRANEAHRVLSDPAERQTYDWVLDRQEKGLPTDPNAVVEAEGLFHRAEGLVRRGQAAAAEPLLRKATQANRGEAEYWAYLGFATFSVRGAAGRDEAKKCFEEALRLKPDLDVTYEFMGRVAHGCGEAGAQAHLERALALNPKNVAAQRELRLLNMRAPGRAASGAPKQKQGLLARLRAFVNGKSG
jgi:curved DNA-binding protein CbpA